MEAIERMKYLVCVDSDGCAIDSMDVKHHKCFGPIAVIEWGLQSKQEDFLQRWNEINLYSASRGINRFLSLAKIAEEYSFCGWESIKHWTETTSSLSNEALSSENNEALIKVLSWSKKTNEAIKALEMSKPFAHVKDVLQFLSNEADIVVVSSANLHAIESEWKAADLLKYTTAVMSQNDGSKSSCIATLIKKGYSNVLMIGDSPGDYYAAKENGVHFYPILPGEEATSWKHLKDKAWDEFKAGKLDESYIIGFKNRLGLKT